MRGRVFGEWLEEDVLEPALGFRLNSLLLTVYYGLQGTEGTGQEGDAGLCQCSTVWMI